MKIKCLNGAGFILQCDVQLIETMKNHAILCVYQKSVFEIFKIFESNKPRAVSLKDDGCWKKT